MKFEKAGRTRGDETAPYKVTDFHANTVGEFIQEVLKENPKEWGYVEVFAKDLSIFDFPKVEYRYGIIKGNNLPKEVLDKRIEKVARGDGEWSRMDYIIKPIDEK